MDALHFLLLKLISEHDGEWSWYQLDRRISTWHREVIDQLPRMMSILRELEAAKLIRADRGARSGFPRYWITDAGGQRLQEEMD